jgi:hypothetical protein
MIGARSVLLIMVLLAGSLSPPGLGAQGTSAPRPPPEESLGFSIEQTYPDVGDPEKWITIDLRPSLFTARSEVTATIRIRNILNQVVAIPEAIDHPAGPGTRVIDLRYSNPGQKVVYWDGRNQAGQRVPSGVYYLEVVIGDEILTHRTVIINDPRRRRRFIPW